MNKKTKSLIIISIVFLLSFIILSCPIPDTLDVPSVQIIMIGNTIDRIELFLGNYLHEAVTGKQIEIIYFVPEFGGMENNPDFTEIDYTVIYWKEISSIAAYTVSNVTIQYSDILEYMLANEVTLADTTGQICAIVNKTEFDTILRQYHAGEVASVYDNLQTLYHNLAGDVFMPYPDQYESNDTHSDATELPVGETLDCTIYPPDNEDWFQVYLESANTYEIRTEHNNGLIIPLSMEVFSNPSSAALETVDTYQSSYPVLDSWSPPQDGTYYIKTDESTGNCGGYSLIVEID